MAHGDKHLSVVVSHHGCGLFYCCVAPRPLCKSRLTKGTDVGGERRQAQRGGESLPTTSEEGLIPATAVYCHGMPSAGLRFRKQEGLQRWFRLIRPHLSLGWLFLRGRWVASVCVLSVSLALQPQEGLWYHLTRYHPGHELAGLTRACQALCRHGIHCQLVVGDLGVSKTYKQAVFSW